MAWAELRMGTVEVRVSFEEGGIVVAEEEEDGDSLLW